MTQNPSEYNDPIAYRPGQLLGRAIKSLCKEHGDNRNVVAKHLACLGLAGFCAGDYAEITRAAKTMALVDPRDSFAVACRLLGPRWAKAKKGESVKTLVDKFVAQLLRLLDDDTSWVNLGTLSDLVGQL